MFFDMEIIAHELRTLSAEDRGKLAMVMSHYEKCGLGDPTPAKIDDYGSGILRIRHFKGAYKGRALFFVEKRESQYLKLVVLVVFRKEAHRVPDRILEMAERRREEYLKK